MNERRPEGYENQDIDWNLASIPELESKINSLKMEQQNDHQKYVDLTEVTMPKLVRAIETAGLKKTSLEEQMQARTSTIDELGNVLNARRERARMMMQMEEFDAIESALTSSLHQVPLREEHAAENTSPLPPRVRQAAHVGLAAVNSSEPLVSPIVRPAVNRPYIQLDKDDQPQPGSADDNVPNGRKSPFRSGQRKAKSAGSTAVPQDADNLLDNMRNNKNATPSSERGLRNLLNTRGRRIGAAALTVTAVTGAGLLFTSGSDGANPEKMSVEASAAIGEGYDDKNKSEGAIELGEMNLTADVKMFMGTIETVTNGVTTNAPIESQLPFNDKGELAKIDPEKTDARHPQVDVEGAVLKGDVLDPDEPSAVQITSTGENTYDVAIDYGQLRGQVSVLEQEEESFYQRDTFTKEGADYVKSLARDDVWMKPEVADTMMKELEKSMNDEETWKNLSLEALTWVANHYVTDEGQQAESQEINNLLKKQAEERVLSYLEEKYPDAKFNLLPSDKSLESIEVIGQENNEDDRGQLATSYKDGAVSKERPPVAEDAHVFTSYADGGK